MPGNPLTRRRLLAAAGWSVLALAGCGRKPRARPVAAGATVLALGDSITYGTGAAPESSYPAVLARLTGWSVINAGVPGDTSAQVLERLPELLLEHAPALVLVGAGGNDFLRRLPPDATRDNLRSICRLCIATGAQVLLIAVPQPSLAAAVVRSLSDHALYAELAEELKVPLHAGGWSTVLSEPALRSDTIHANAQGYEKFARGLTDVVKDAGLLLTP